MASIPSAEPLWHFHYFLILILLWFWHEREIKIYKILVPFHFPLHFTDMLCFVLM